MQRRTRIAAVVLAAAALGSCASTSIRRGPDGFEYASDKDINIEGLEIERTLPDGTKEIVRVKKAGGTASTVNAGWQQVIEALVNRIPATPAP